MCRELCESTFLQIFFWLLFWTFFFHIKIFISVKVIPAKPRGSKSGLFSFFQRAFKTFKLLNLTYLRQSVWHANEWNHIWKSNFTPRGTEMKHFSSILEHKTAQEPNIYAKMPISSLSVFSFKTSEKCSRTRCRTYPTHTAANFSGYTASKILCIGSARKSGIVPRYN